MGTGITHFQCSKTSVLRVSKANPRHLSIRNWVGHRGDGKLLNAHDLADEDGRRWYLAVYLPQWRVTAKLTIACSSKNHRCRNSQPATVQVHGTVRHETDPMGANSFLRSPATMSSANLGLHVLCHDSETINERPRLPTTPDGGAMSPS